MPSMYALEADWIELIGHWRCSAKELVLSFVEQIRGLAKWVPCVPKLFFDDGLMQSTHSFLYLEYYHGRIGKFICGSGYRSQ